MTINYDAPATLHKWASVEQRRAGDPPTFSSSQIWDGTLYGCIKKYLAQPPSEKLLCDIMIGEEAGTGNTILEPEDIAIIAARPDFPIDI
jgi:hypothetical protein